MQNAYCCGREMYQEISSSNILLSSCRICGRSTERRVNFSGRAPDGIEYFAVKDKDTVENFNINLERGKDETM